VAEAHGQVRVSLLAIPDAMISSLGGVYDVLNSFPLLGSFDDAVPGRAPFAVEIVGLDRAPIVTASGLPVSPQRTLGEVIATDIVIVPSLLVQDGCWVRGRHPAVVDWLAAVYARGAMLCSTCSGVLLLAETGLLDGREATIHWAYAPTFRDNFPAVRLIPEKVLVATGEREEFVMSGASASWNDLVLYLIARHVGPTAAQAIARFMLLQWHEHGQAFYAAFQPRTDHGDAVVLAVQEWIARHAAAANPVAEMVHRSGLAERSFKRRFTNATGFSPITYVQRLRMEAARRRLERSDDPIDEIGWAIGYEDPAFFRRLFKRLMGVTPGIYRRKLRPPAISRGAPPGATR
jgi:transcriptional regulator GlxA family with amidase domain